MTTRHEFLLQLHETLKPRGYLEIGVFSGDSLRLVQRGTPAIGVDPAPHVHGHVPGTTQLHKETSDDFFVSATISSHGHTHYVLSNLDLAFIDGMHLFEYALRDFMNVEKYANPRTVVVFDDVLPRNDHEAAREQCPGDWTGDVWKAPRILQMQRPDLQIHTVNTFPTGTAVVFGLDPTSTKLQDSYNRVMSYGLDQWNTVPQEIINREGALAPTDALDLISVYLETVEGT